MFNESLSPVKQALLEIRELRAALSQVQAARHEPIAIVGMALRAPGDVVRENGAYVDEYRVPLGFNQQLVIVARGGASQTLPGTRLDMYISLLRHG